MFTEKKWETDAGNISNYSDFDRFVYRNGSVNAFLNDAGKCFIIAAKGMGKTLLLSYKRHLLEKKYPSVVFIPTEHPYISFIQNINTTLSKEHISRFESWEYCKKAWTTVIELSVLSYTGIDLETFLVDLPPRVQRHNKWLEHILKTPHSVEYVFNEIIVLSETGLTQLIEDISNLINFEFQKINRGVILFFDRFDNALETAHDSIWKPIQVGLLEAAWDVMRSNHHVKIYLSIRQEAYAAHTSRNFNAIATSVVKIEYSREELKELLNHLVMYYESKETLEDFLGFEMFPNTVVYEEEKVYDFMFRYSIGRPRDFVQFCDELSKVKDDLYLDKDDRRLKLKEKVRKISSDAIIYNLFEELRMLLGCLNTQSHFDEFLTCLKHNVLTYTEIKSICKKFNEGTCINNCEVCSYSHHPFCDLYNMGLLGLVSSKQDLRIQHFKTPYEDMIHGLRSDIDYFLIHPALREYINKLHMHTPLGLNYRLFKGILVGVDLPWLDQYDNLCTVNKWIEQLEDIETRHFFEKSLEESIIHTQDWIFSIEEYNSIRKDRYPIYEQRINDSLIDYFTTGKVTAPRPISIFVSYAYDSDIHKRQVEGFVNLLRGMGFAAEMDSSLKEDHPNLDDLMTVGLQMDKLIIVLSPEYKRKADGRKGGVWKEFQMIADDLEKNPTKYVFVSFEEYSEDLKGRISPIRIGNRWIVDLVKDRNNDYSELLSLIKEEKEYLFKAVNKTMASVKRKQIQPF